MAISEKRKTEGILVSKSILSGLFPVLTVVAYTNRLSPLNALAYGSIVAAAFFAVVLTVRKEWGKNIKKVEALKDIAMAILLIAIVYHALFYFSLKLTSPQNVALISTAEAAFSFIIIGWITKKEPVSPTHFFGAMLMLFAAGMVLFENLHTSMSIGDLLMLLAVIVAPVGNIFAKKALAHVSVPYLMFLRSFTGIIIFFSASMFFEKPASAEVVIESLPYLLYSGLIYLGLMKIINFFGFKKTSITHTISFNSLAPVFTFIFAWIFLRDAPTAVQVFAIVPSAVGLFFLATAKQKETRYGFEKEA